MDAEAYVRSPLTSTCLYFTYMRCTHQKILHMCVFKNTWLTSEGEGGRCDLGGSRCTIIMSWSESGFESSEDWIQAFCWMLESCPAMCLLIPATVRCFHSPFHRCTTLLLSAALLFTPSVFKGDPPTTHDNIHTVGYGSQSIRSNPCGDSPNTFHRLSPPLEGSPSPDQSSSSSPALPSCAVDRCRFRPVCTACRFL